MFLCFSLPACLTRNKIFVGRNFSPYLECELFRKLKVKTKLEYFSYFLFRDCPQMMSLFFLQIFPMVQHIDYRQSQHVKFQLLIFFISLLFSFCGNFSGKPKIDVAFEMWQANLIKSFFVFYLVSEFNLVLKSCHAFVKITAPTKFTETFKSAEIFVWGKC